MLKGAITDFVVRNYNGTVALCGLVAELMANFLLDVWNNTVTTIPLDERAQTGIFGKTFDDLSQKRRLDLLFELGVIDSSTKSYFETIRKIRNRYVHSYTIDLKDLEKDAWKIFRQTNKMLEQTIGMEISDKKLLMNGHISEYLLNIEGKRS